MGKVKAYKIWQCKDENELLIEVERRNNTFENVKKLLDTYEELGYDIVPRRTSTLYRFKKKTQKGQTNETIH